MVCANGARLGGAIASSACGSTGDGTACGVRECRNKFLHACNPAMPIGRSSEGCMHQSGHCRVSPAEGKICNPNPSGVRLPRHRPPTPGKATCIAILRPVVHSVRRSRVFGHLLHPAVRSVPCGLDEECSRDRSTRESAMAADSPAVHLHLHLHMHVPVAGTGRVQTPRCVGEIPVYRDRRWAVLFRRSENAPPRCASHGSCGRHGDGYHAILYFLACCRVIPMGMSPCCSSSAEACLHCPVDM